MWLKTHEQKLTKCLQLNLFQFCLWLVYSSAPVCREQSRRCRYQQNSEDSGVAFGNHKFKMTPSVNKANFFNWLLAKDEQLNEKDGITHRYQQWSGLGEPLESASCNGKGRKSAITSGESRSPWERITLYSFWVGPYLQDWRGQRVEGEAECKLATPPSTSSAIAFIGLFYSYPFRWV